MQVRERETRAISVNLTQLNGRTFIPYSYLRLVNMDGVEEPGTFLPHTPGQCSVIPYSCQGCHKAGHKGAAVPALFDSRCVLSTHHSWRIEGGVHESAWYVNHLTPGIFAVSNERPATLAQGKWWYDRAHACLLVRPLSYFAAP